MIFLPGKFYMETFAYIKSHFIVMSDDTILLYLLRSRWTESISELVFTTLYIFRSSTNSEHLQCLKFWVVNKIKTRNKREPKWQPYGNPLSAKEVSDSKTFTATGRGIFVKYGCGRKYLSQNLPKQPDCGCT